jgi:hypothetical protein
MTRKQTACRRAFAARPARYQHFKCWRRIRTYRYAGNKRFNPFRPHDY